MDELTMPATIDNIAPVTDFVNHRLAALDCPSQVRIQLDVAIDEIFGNIARYAYTPEVGTATVRMEVEEDPLAVVLTFMDRGKPYDPLAAPPPDVTLSAKERRIGGLGVFIVKKKMDSMHYEYRDGMNVLTVRKVLRPVLPL